MNEWLGNLIVETYTGHINNIQPPTALLHFFWPGGALMLESKTLGCVILGVAVIGIAWFKGSSSPPLVFVEFTKDHPQTLVYVRLRNTGRLPLYFNKWRFDVDPETTPTCPLYSFGVNVSPGPDYPDDACVAFLRNPVYNQDTWVQDVESFVHGDKFVACYSHVPPYFKGVLTHLFLN